MATRMQQRRGTAAQWTAANPVLAAGEIGFETDTNKFKIGDGVNAWNTLVHYASAADLAALVDGAPALLNTLNELAASIGDDPAFLTTMNGLLDSISADLATHDSLAANVHGISNTGDLAYKSELSAHTGANTGVHGITDTALLETLSGAQAKADAAEADAIAAAASALSSHESDTTNVHGIANTAVLETTSGSQAKADAAEADAITAAGSAADTKVSDHNANTTSVHGIANTALLETLSGAQSKADAAEAAAISAAASAADTKVSDHNSDTTNVHGISDTAALATKTYADGAVSTAVSALTKSSVGLANVDNTSDANKPVSTAAQTALDLKAPLADPTFTGTVSGITKAHVGLGNVDNTADSAKPVSTAQATAIATAKSEAIADATAQVNAVIASAPAALNTLDELAAALGDDANFATTVTNGLAAKAPINAPTFTGTVTVAAAGVAFTDGTQTKAGVPSITTFGSSFAATATLAAGEQDKFVPVAGAVTITLPATGYSTGQSIDFYQASGTGAQFSNANSTVGTPGLKFRTTNSVVTAMKTAAGWLVFGDLSA
jgi:Major tropism determinant N-terminal domain